MGGGSGIFYQKEKDALQIENAQKMETIVRAMSSEMVLESIVSGKVFFIEGRNITLVSGENSFIVRIKEDAIIYFLRPVPVEIGLTQKQLVFEDIKYGDNLEIGFKLLPDGILEGQEINVFPISNSVH